MSLLFATGFDATTSLGTLFEATNSGSIGAVGRNGTNGMNFVNGDQGVRKNLGAAVGTLIIGFAVDIVTHTGLSAKGLLRLANSGNTVAELLVTSSGTLSFTGAAGTGFLPFSGYPHVEVRVVIGNGTAGAVEVRVNGVPVITQASIDTSGSGHTTVDQVGFGVQNADYSGGFNRNFDDIILMDTSGSVFNDFLGDQRVIEQLPTGDGDEEDFTLSTGSNMYALLDDSSPNSDTDYIESATVGHKALLTFPSLPVATGVVRCSDVIAYARKTDAGTRILSGLVKHSGTEDTGAQVGQGTSYTYMRGHFPECPSTSAAWTIAQVNAAQHGIEVVS